MYTRTWGTLVYSLIRRTFCRVCTESDCGEVGGQAQSLVAQNSHPSIQWPCSTVLNCWVLPGVLSLSAIKSHGLRVIVVVTSWFWRIRNNAVWVDSWFRRTTFTGTAVVNPELVWRDSQGHCCCHQLILGFTGIVVNFELVWAESQWWVLTADLEKSQTDRGVVVDNLGVTEVLLLLTVGLEECLGGMGAASSLFWRITRVLLFLTGLEGSLGSRFIAVVSNWINSVETWLWYYVYQFCDVRMCPHADSFNLVISVPVNLLFMHFVIIHGFSFHQPFSWNAPKVRPGMSDVSSAQYHRAIFWFPFLSPLLLFCRGLLLFLSCNFSAHGSLFPQNAIDFIQRQAALYGWCCGAKTW